MQQRERKKTGLKTFPYCPWEINEASSKEPLAVVKLLCVSLLHQNLTVQTVVSHPNDTHWPQRSGLWCVLKASTNALITEKISTAIIVRCEIKCLAEIRLHPLSPHRSHCAFISLLSSLVEAIGSSNQIMVQLILGAWSSALSRHASESPHKFTERERRER